MRFMSNTMLRTMALAVFSVALAGCPPEEPEPQDDGAALPPPEPFDFKDYWPLTEGNVWFMSSLYEKGNAFEYEVLEEFKGTEASGWHLRFRKYSKEPSQAFERDEYVILLGDFLYHTYNKDRMHEVIDDPKNVGSVENVGEMAPRHFFEGANEIDGMLLYHSVAGPLKSITPFVECDGVRSAADDFPIPLDVRTMMLMDKQYCADPQDPFRAAPGFGFAEGIGMIYFYGHVLSYAYVDGVEYTFQP